MFDNKITDTEDRASQQNFKVELFDYQLAAINRMKLYEKMHFSTTVNNCTDGGNVIERMDIDINTDFAILGDRVGSGKTLTVLGLVSDTRNQKIEYNYYNMCSTYKYKSNPPVGTYINTTLVVYEKNNTRNWKEELEKTDLKYIIIDKTPGVVEYPFYNIVLIPSNMLKQIVYSTFGYIFKRIVIDNCRVNNYQNSIELIKTYFTWYVTDDYKSLIRGRFKPLKDIKDLELVVVKCKKYLYNNDRDESKEYVTYSKNFCKNNFACFISEKRARIIKKAMIENSLEKVINFSGIESCTKEDYLYNLNVSDNRLKEIKNKISDIKSEHCCICLDVIKKPVILSCCNSFYCLQCVVLFLIADCGKCPMCRSSKMDPTLILDKPFKKLKDKLSTLLDKINELDIDSRFVVVSNDFRINDILTTLDGKNIQILKGKIEIVFANFNKRILDGLIIEDVSKIKGNVFKNVQDVFFLDPLSENLRKRVIYLCLNAVSSKLRVHDIIVEN